MTQVVTGWSVIEICWWLRWLVLGLVLVNHQVLLLHAAVLVSSIARIVGRPVHLAAGLILVPVVVEVNAFAFRLWPTTTTDYDSSTY